MAAVAAAGRRRRRHCCLLLNCLLAATKQLDLSYPFRTRCERIQSVTSVLRPCIFSFLVNSFTCAWLVIGLWRRKSLAVSSRELALSRYPCVDICTIFNVAKPRNRRIRCSSCCNTLPTWRRRRWLQQSSIQFLYLRRSFCFAS